MTLLLIFSVVFLAFTNGANNTRVKGGLRMIFIAAFLGFMPVQVVATQGAPDTLNDQKAPLKKGDRCLVCNVLLDENGLGFLYRGRRVTLHIQHAQTFLDNPLHYFSKLQPRGALFQEDVLRSPVNLGWLILGIWMVLGLVAAAFCTHTALRKGFPPVIWFFIGLVANLIGVLLVLRQPPVAQVDLPPRLGKIPVTAPPVRCPKCGAENHPSARQCTGCCAEMQPTMASEVTRTGLSS